MKKTKVSKCAICGKPLSDPISVEIGEGPVCRVNKKVKYEKEKTANLFEKEAKYSYEILQGVLCIIDLGGFVSVTNDAYNVVTTIIKECNIAEPIPPIIYKDSEGIFDEITFINRQIGFYPLTEKAISQAINKVRNKYNLK